MPHNPIYHMISRDELQRCMFDSVRNVFSVMADIAPEECHEGPDGHHENWVTALVGFEGACRGLVALHCPEPLARRAAAGLLCAGEAIDTRDVFDAMGEMVNILSGDMKLLLDRGGRQVRLSMPSVFVGDEEFRNEFLSRGEAVFCSMASGNERMLIGVQVSSR